MTAQLPPGPWRVPDDLHVIDMGNPPDAPFCVVHSDGPEEQTAAIVKAIAALPKLIEALAMSVAQMEVVRSKLADAGVSNLGAGPLGTQCDFNRSVLRDAGILEEI